MISRRVMLKGATMSLLAQPAFGGAANAGIAPIPTSLASLKAADPRIGRVYLDAAGRTGWFRWQMGDRRQAVDGDPFEGVTVASTQMPASSGAWIREGSVLTPEMFGALPEQDDHSAILSATFDQIRQGTEIVLAGDYRISQAIERAGASHFRIGGGGRISMIGQAPVRYGFGILYFSDCSDFLVSSLTLDANRQMRSAAEAPAHTVTLQSCRRFEFVSVTALNAVCDGFMLFSARPENADTHCSDFAFTDCVAENSFRQGCTVTEGHRGVFRRGRYAGSRGTLPAAGIDLESDEGAPHAAISDITFDGVTFADNDGFGLLVAGVARPQDIIVKDCRFVSNRRGAISWGASGGSIIRPAIEGFVALAERGAIDIPAGDGWRGGGTTTITSPVFTDVSTTRSQNPLIYVHAAAYGPVHIDGLMARRCAAIVSLHRDGSRFVRSTVTAALGSVDGAIGIAGDGCRVERNEIHSFFGSAMVVTGNGAVIRDNVLTGPRYNDGNGAIRVLADHAVIESNTLEATRGRTAIRITGTKSQVRGNRIRGFSQTISSP